MSELNTTQEKPEVTAPEIAELIAFAEAANLPACTAPTQRVPVQSSAPLWTCQICSGDFVSYKGLKQHMGKKHSPKKKHSKCPQCDKKFKTKYATKFHLQQVHEKRTRVRCDSCGIELYNKYALRTHVKTYHYST